MASGNRPVSGSHVGDARRFGSRNSEPKLAMESGGSRPWPYFPKRIPMADTFTEKRP